MFQHFELLARRRLAPLARLRRDLSRCREALGLMLVVLVLAAMPALGAPVGVEPEAAAALLAELGDRYEVLSLSDRYVLQPADREAGFRTIEIKAGSVAIDGEDVTLDQLRDLVGEAAGTIFAVSALGSVPGPTAEELRDGIERRAAKQRYETEDIEAEALGEARGKPRSRRHRGSVRTDTRVSFGSSLTIEGGETSEDVVVLGGSLDVEGKVNGDAVVVGGSAEIRGQVSGTVTAVGGSISLGPGARIEGDAIAVGGAVHRDPTAEIYGEITEVSLAPGFELDDLWHGLSIPHWRFGWFDFGLGELFVRIGKTVVLAVLLLLLVVLFPRRVAGVAERARREPWKAGIVGLGTQLLFLFALPVICIVLLITIVGIPLALLLAPLATLALVALFLVGLAGIAMAGGELLQARFGWRGANPYLLVLLGLALIQGWSILGEVLGWLGGPIRLVAWLVLLLGFLVKYLAWTTGLGAVLMHSFSPLPALPRPVPAMPPPAPTDSPPPPSPADWDDMTVDAESEAEAAADPDEKYRQAGAGPEADQEEGSGKEDPPASD